jgi:ABC-type methionine transport system ATPase subunit
MLEIKQLVKKYHTGDLAVNGVDLKVEKGQVMALIGPSGAGKSTLIRCVNRLEKQHPAKSGSMVKISLKCVRGSYGVPEGTWV